MKIIFRYNPEIEVHQVPHNIYFDDSSDLGEAEHTAFTQYWLNTSPAIIEWREEEENTN